MNSHVKESGSDSADPNALFMPSTLFGSAPGPSGEDVLAELQGNTQEDLPLSLQQSGSEVDSDMHRLAEDPADPWRVRFQQPSSTSSDTHRQAFAFAHSGDEHAQHAHAPSLSGQRSESGEAEPAGPPLRLSSSLMSASMEGVESFAHAQPVQSPPMHASLPMHSAQTLQTLHSFSASHAFAPSPSPSQPAPFRAIAVADHAPSFSSSPQSQTRSIAMHTQTPSSHAHIVVPSPSASPFGVAMHANSLAYAQPQSSVFSFSTLPSTAAHSSASHSTQDFQSVMPVHVEQPPVVTALTVPQRSPQPRSPPIRTTNAKLAADHLTRVAQQQHLSAPSQSAPVSVSASLPAAEPLSFVPPPAGLPTLAVPVQPAPSAPRGKAAKAPKSPSTTTSSAAGPRIPCIGGLLDSQAQHNTDFREGRNICSTCRDGEQLTVREKRCIVVPDIESLNKQLSFRPPNKSFYDEVRIGGKATPVRRFWQKEINHPAVLLFKDQKDAERASQVLSLPPPDTHTFRFCSFHRLFHPAGVFTGAPGKKTCKNKGTRKAPRPAAAPKPQRPRALWTSHRRKTIVTANRPVVAVKYPKSLSLTAEDTSSLAVCVQYFGLAPVLLPFRAASSAGFGFTVDHIDRQVLVSVPPPDFSRPLSADAVHSPFTMPPSAAPHSFASSATAAMVTDDDRPSPASPSSVPSSPPSEDSLSVHSPDSHSQDSDDSGRPSPSVSPSPATRTFSTAMQELGASAYAAQTPKIEAVFASSFETKAPNSNSKSTPSSLRFTLVIHHQGHEVFRGDFTYQGVKLPSAFDPMPVVKKENDSSHSERDDERKRQREAEKPPNGTGRGTKRREAGMDGSDKPPQKKGRQRADGSFEPLDTAEVLIDKGEKVDDMSRLSKMGLLGFGRELLVDLEDQDQTLLDSAADGSASILCAVRPKSQLAVRIVCWLILSLVPALLMLLAPGFWTMSSAAHQTDSSGALVDSTANELTGATKFSLTAMLIIWTISVFNAFVQDVKRPALMASFFAVIFMGASITTLRLAGPGEAKTVRPYLLPLPNLGKCEFVSHVPACPALTNFIAATPDAWSCAALPALRGTLGQMTTAQKSDAIERFLSMVPAAATVAQYLTKEHIDRCLDLTRQNLCSVFFPPCTDQCQPRLPCVDSLRSLIDACGPTVVGLGRMLLPAGDRRDGLELFIEDPIARRAIDVHLENVILAHRDVNVSLKHACDVPQDPMPTSKSGNTRLAEGGRVEARVGDVLGTVSHSINQQALPEVAKTIGNVICNDLGLGSGVLVDSNLTVPGPPEQPVVLGATLWQNEQTFIDCSGENVQSLLDCRGTTTDHSMFVPLHVWDVSVQCDRMPVSLRFGAQPHCVAMPANSVSLAEPRHPLDPNAIGRLQPTAADLTPNCNLDSYFAANQSRIDSQALAEFTATVAARVMWRTVEMVLIVVALLAVVAALVANLFTGKVSACSLCCQPAPTASLPGPGSALLSTGSQTIPSFSSLQDTETGDMLKPLPSPAQPAINSQAPQPDISVAASHAGFRLLHPRSWALQVGVTVFANTSISLCLASITAYLGLISTTNSGFSFVFNMVALLTVFCALLPPCWWLLFEDTAEKRMRYELMLARARTGTLAARFVYQLIRLRSRYTTLFGLRGKYFYQRQHVVEFVETAVQFNAMLAVAKSADLLQFLPYLIVVSANLICLPLFALSNSPRIRRDLTVTFDVLTDAFFFIYGAYRGIDSMMWDQVASICLPCAMNAFRLYDLSVFVLRNKSKRRTAASVQTEEDQLPADSHHCKGHASWIASLGIVALGVLLLVSTITRSMWQRGECSAIVGSVVWSASSPKVYFQNGLFTAPVCSFDLVTSLSVANTGLQELPDRISVYTNVVEIDARNNPDLTSLPISLTRMSSLRVLDARNCGISHLEPVLCEDLGRITEVRFDDNPIARVVDWSHAGLGASWPTSHGDTERVLPACLRFLRPQQLLLSANNISQLLDELPNSLEVLDLSRNRLTTLEPRVFDRLSLRVLDASHNRLQELSTLFRLSHMRLLESLDLSNNELVNITADIAKLPLNCSIRLFGNPTTTLWWYASNLQRIPAEVCQLEHLQELTFDYNPITALPLGLDRCTALKVLRLPYTRLSCIDVPLPPNLEEIQMNMARLQSLPDRIGKLNRLRILKAGYMNITALPESMAQLHNLTLLAVHFNHIQRWPPFVADLLHKHNLKVFTGYANPASGSHAEVERMLGVQCECAWVDDAHVATTATPAVAGVCPVSCNALPAPTMLLLKEGESGIIRAPASGKQYPSGQVCGWSLVAPPKHRVHMWFSHFALDGEGQSSEEALMADRVELYEAELISTPTYRWRDIWAPGVRVGKMIPMNRNGTLMQQGTLLSGDPDTTLPGCKTSGLPCRPLRRAVDFRCPRPFIDTFTSAGHIVGVAFLADFEEESSGFVLHYQVVPE